MTKTPPCKVKRLWTPWRMKFILSDKTAGCIFCDKPAVQKDEENYILYRGTHGFIMLNAYPYATGHLLVAPYAHVSTPEALDEPTLSEIMQMVNRGIAASRIAQNPHGFNIGVNLGAVAGAGIADHVHFHVVPRWQGDTNFIPVMDNVRLLPEWLADTYKRFMAAGIADPDFGKKSK